MIMKSISIKGQGCKFGRCAVKAVVLTPGGLGRVPESGLRGSSRPSDRGPGVSRGHSRAKSLKGRTVGVASRPCVIKMQCSGNSG